MVTSPVTLAYQWQSSFDGVNFTNLTNDVSHSGVTNASVSITNLVLRSTTWPLRGFGWLRAIVSQAARFHCFSRLLRRRPCQYRGV